MLISAASSAQSLHETIDWINDNHPSITIYAEGAFWDWAQEYNEPRNFDSVIVQIYDCEMRISCNIPHSDFISGLPLRVSIPLSSIDTTQSQFVNSTMTIRLFRHQEGITLTGHAGYTDKIDASRASAPENLRAHVAVMEITFLGEYANRYMKAFRHLLSFCPGKSDDLFK